MSPRAASRLESLGYSKVFDYVTGLADWSANGLPTEGTLAAVPRAGDIVRPDPATCRPTDRVGEVRNRVQAAGQGVCIVTDDGGVVLGRLRGEALDADPEATVESVMETGPTTIRPDVPLEEMTERMRQRRVGSIIVTTSEGKLIGILYRRDAEARLAKRSS